MLEVVEEFAEARPFSHQYRWFRLPVIQLVLIFPYWNGLMRMRGMKVDQLAGFVLCFIMMAIAASAATLKVDKKRSRIQVDGKSTGHEFAGTLVAYSAKLTGDPGTLKPKSFELSWKFSDLKTQESKRDKKMIEWLGGGSPKGSFKFIKSWENGGRHYAQGKISFHGVSKVIAFPYTVTKKGDWVTIDGTAKLNYKDFGLPIIRAMAVMTVDPNLSVRFHIVGKL